MKSRSGVLMGLLTGVVCAIVGVILLCIYGGMTADSKSIFLVFGIIFLIFGLVGVLTSVLTIKRRIGNYKEYRARRKASKKSSKK
ncbi:MAG: hypothetical protein LBM76_02285 [Mycoplasmataceae bacterium]|jgi:uncharacterized membrane protein|nr:hypothetical protein [Mycoplasmataceae bacterium]